MPKIKNLLPKEVLENLYSSQNLSDKKISEIYKCSDVAISNLRKLYGISTKSQFKRLLTNKKSKFNVELLTNDEFEKEYLSTTLEHMALKYSCSTLKIKNDRKKRGINKKTETLYNKLPPVTELQKIILIGSLLGDGHVAMASPKKAFFKESHSINQDIYVKLLHEKLYPFSNKLSKLVNEIGQDELSFKTKPLEYLYELRETFYSNGEKRLPVDFLCENWNSGFLAYWFFGDGGLTSEEKFEINTSFKEGILSFINLINAKEGLGIELKNYHSAPKMYELSIKNSDKFFSIIVPYLTADMLYKVPQKYYGQISEDLLKKFRARAVLGFNNDIKKYKSRLFNLLSETEKNVWINQVFSYYKELGFPYINMSDELLQKKLSDFKDVNVQEFNGLLKFKTTGLNICKHFMPHIYEARSGSHRSPIDYWQDKENVINLIKNRFKYAQGVTETPMRVGIDLIFHTVDNYKPSISKWICNKFGKGGVVYLPDAGYGGKLLGALFSNCSKIICLDPLEKTIEASIKMHTRINPELPVNMVLGCSEEYNPLELNKKIDLILSCPPYFNLEKYSEDLNQSIVKYPEYSSWINNFLKKSVDNFYDLLSDSGYYAVVINDIKGFDLISDLFDCCKGKLGLVAQYQIPMGSIFKENDNNIEFVQKYEPLFIFKKQSYNDIEPDFKAKETRKNRYKNLKRVSFTECVNTLKDLSLRGINTTRTYLNEHPEIFPYSTSSVELYFGSWNKFLLAAEIKPTHSEQSCYDKVIAYRLLCKKHNRFLTFMELEKLEGIPPSRYKRMFNAGKPYSHLKEELPQVLMADDRTFQTWLNTNFLDE